MTDSPRVIKICPEPLANGFRFVNHCPITTCKNWSERSLSRCLSLHRDNLVDDELLSMTEAAHYRGVSVDDAQAAYTEATRRVKALTLFHHYWLFSASAAKGDANTSPVATVHLGEWLTNYPMAVGMWNPSDFATIKRLFMPENFEAFVGSHKHGDDAYSLGQLAVLHVTKPRYQQICAELSLNL